MPLSNAVPEKVRFPMPEASDHHVLLHDINREAQSQTGAEDADGVGVEAPSHPSGRTQTQGGGSLECK